MSCCKCCFKWKNCLKWSETVSRPKLRQDDQDGHLFIYLVIYSRHDCAESLITGNDLRVATQLVTEDRKPSVGNTVVL